MAVPDIRQWPQSEGEAPLWRREALMDKQSKGIYQDKSGRYLARYTSKKTGRRIGRRFDTFEEAYEWRAGCIYMDRYGMLRPDPNMTVDQLFDAFIEERKITLRRGTILNYIQIYSTHIKPVIGDMRVSEVRNMHIQRIANIMSDAEVSKGRGGGKTVRKGYRQSSIVNTIVLVNELFGYARTNRLIDRHPCERRVKIPKLSAAENAAGRKIHAMSIEEERAFIQTVDPERYGIFLFILWTGVRIGEASALEFDDIEDLDGEEPILHVRRTLRYHPTLKEWDEHDPKTFSGFRTIPLTPEAADVVKKCRDRRKHELSRIPSRWKKKIFLAPRYDENGEDTGGPIGPVKSPTYDAAMNRICRKAGIAHFTTHDLRHTFATRCNESGMNPKTLQKILGHKYITTTLDTYVHTMTEVSQEEMDGYRKYITSKITG